ncbi:unnamed protein product [Angiostrongylus costaricensis]|uniref:Uncharacterized protein n=1 Tax=Angiostrongylus costaricensis TaxID=334426 RepID=A0A3P7H800_ANGCS|nr:unnamed protein product [Angiostrongylus costaricensis]
MLSLEGLHNSSHGILAKLLHVLQDTFDDCAKYPLSIEQWIKNLSLEQRFLLQIQYSATQLQYENIKHRCKMLDNENQRLMRVQNELITDANRRVEMHVNEIRMLKEENKKLVAANKELRELCCFLDDDRQKTRRLAKEWQKFGRYTSQVMKQEMSMNQQRLRESEERHMEAIRENEELKQLCLYLDEQRQRFTGYRAEDDGESEDLGTNALLPFSAANTFIHHHTTWVLRLTFLSVFYLPVSSAIARQRNSSGY